ncbi:MAG TPA: hypothetical protein P5052_00505 [Candidatus Paceibacterota bacterium]|mgnify:CR=1 FL=1|nr:hypothetical protein [Candidatus Paceibacterota bacterium]HRZ29284.1 hypothetical protein [Candidatus Paceibacterota bacterium]
MPKINKNSKINIFLLISLVLLIIFIFLIAHRIMFIANNIEKVLVDHNTTTRQSKNFNIDQFKELTTKMPIK